MKQEEKRCETCLHKSPDKVPDQVICRKKPRQFVGGPHQDEHYLSWSYPVQELNDACGEGQWRDECGRLVSWVEEDGREDQTVVFKADRVKEAKKILTETVKKYRVMRHLSSPRPQPDNLADWAFRVAEAHVALEDAIEVETERITNDQ